MKVTDFYKGCEKRELYQSFSNKGRDYVFAIILRQMYEGMKTNIVVDMAMIRKKMEEGYEPSFFSFEWQKQVAIDQDITKIERFLKWLGTPKVLDANVANSYVCGKSLLETTTSLVVEWENGTYGALNIFQGKPDKSFKGKSMHTNMKNDLHLLVTKACLEEKYSGIVVTNCFLTNDGDDATSLVSEFGTGETKKSQAFSLDFKDFCTDGKLDEYIMGTAISTVLNTPVTKSCFTCHYASVCGTKKVVSNKGVEVDEAPYQMPSFTTEQLPAINHKEGPLMVVAGPGSGKTATIVGRIKYLIDNGVEPDYILALSFTREAAKELQTRVASFCEEDVPTCSTIHALAYEILKNNKDVIGKELKLLSSKQREEAYEAILEIVGSCGLTTDALSSKGKLLKALDRKIEIFSEEDVTFAPFMEVWENLRREKGWINYKEQIALCVKLFEDHPEINDIYSSIYKYIIVDEYQDIDDEQQMFIELLASHGNLMVVGDDDQTIYRFRGANVKHFLEFKEAHKNTKVVRLNENFRSTKEIVEVANSFIESGSMERLPKNIYSSVSGAKPVEIQGIGSDTVKEVIEGLVREGYSYKDIAVLSFKNSILEDYHNNLGLPTYLDKNYLINDGFCLMVSLGLSLIEDNSDNLKTLRLLKLLGYEDYDLIGYKGVDNLFEACKENLTSFIGRVNFAKRLPLKKGILQLAKDAGFETSGSVQSLLTLIEENELTSWRELSDYLSYMIEVGDDTRLQEEVGNRVTLITNHESKGKQFNVVLLIDDFTEVSDDSKRLYYVALTRAAKKLFILTKGEKSLIKKEVG